VNGNASWLEKDFYAALGVSDLASPDEIKRAYRKLAQKHHPDRNPGDKAAEDRMKDASEAYDVLSDPKKRAEYDEMRRLARSGFRAGGGFPGGGNVRVEDLGDLGGVLGDLFGGMFGGGGAGGSGRGGRGNRVRTGVDLEAEVTLSFDDAMRGTTIKVPVTREVQCSTCGGTGAKPGTGAKTCSACGGRGIVGENQGFFSFQQPCRQCGGSGKVIEDPCKTCRGEGTVRKREDVTIRIPPGVRDGARIRAAGRGDRGGDLFVTVHVGTHRLFGRSGADLRLDVPITFAEAALGAQIKVPTLDGTVTVKIPPGTQDGQTFRVKGKGAPKPKGGAGDLLVTVHVAVPTKLSGKEKEIVERLAEAQNGSIRSHLGVEK
jgi:molecular chaperone DnaJ